MQQFEMICIIYPTLHCLCLQDYAMLPTSEWTDHCCKIALSFIPHPTTHVQTCMCICITHTHTYTHTQTHTHTCTQVCTRACTHTCTKKIHVTELEFKFFFFFNPVAFRLNHCMYFLLVESELMSSGSTTKCHCLTDWKRLTAFIDWNGLEIVRFNFASHFNRKWQMCVHFLCANNCPA